MIMLRIKAITFLLFIIGFAIPLSGSATAPNIFVPSGADRASLNDFVYYFIDESGTLDINDVVSKNTTRFSQLDKTLKLGYSLKNKVLWAKFTIDNSATKQSEWYFSYEYEHIANLRIYHEVNGTWVKTILDESLPNEGRSFQTNQYTVPLPIHGGIQTYYVRFEPKQRYFLLSMSWANVKGFVETNQTSAITYGLFFGALCVIWFYNIALFGYLRDRLYLFYIYYLGCFIATFFHIYGWSNTFMELNPVWESIFAACGYGTIHALILFSRRFLALRENYPKVNAYLQFMQWLLVGGAVVAFMLPPGPPWYYLNFFVLLTIPVVAVVGFLRARTYMPARIYSVGWALFALALAILSARALNIVPNSVFTIYGIMVASVWEAALFSLALGYRIKLLDAQVTEERLKVIETEREATRKRELFLAMIAHELRSPLTSVSFGLDMLELNTDAPKKAAAVTRIRRAADGLEGQLRDLLTLSAGNQGKIEIRPNIFDAKKLVFDYADEQRQTTEAKGLTLNISVPDAEILVIADPVRIGQVLKNLISNAIKYTDNGSVDVVLEPIRLGRPHLVIHVNDTGTGIPGDVQKQVFEPFTRFDAMVRGQEGSGIGLAVVKTVLEHLGGAVSVHSRESGGTSITVEIPVSMPAPTEEVANRDTKHVLVVDDRDDVLAGLASLARELGYQVDEALGSAIGANLLAARKYDVALIDLDMPVKSGSDLAAETRRSNGPNAKTWLIAFSAGSKDLGKVLWPFDAFLPKPLTRHSLRAAIEEGAHAASKDAQGGFDVAKPPVVGP